jgi:hypothetical protein
VRGDNYTVDLTDLQTSSRTRTATFQNPDALRGGRRGTGRLHQPAVLRRSTTCVPPHRGKKLNHHDICGTKPDPGLFARAKASAKEPLGGTLRGNRCRAQQPQPPVMSAHQPRAVSLRFVFGLITLLLAFAVLLVLIVVWVDNRTDNVPQVLGAVLSPVTGIVGAILGHHVGSRHG